MPRPTSRNVDDLVRYGCTKKRYTVILSMLIVYINNGLKCLKRKANNCTTFLLPHALVMPGNICKAKFPKQQQHIWP